MRTRCQFLLNLGPGVFLLALIVRLTGVTSPTSKPRSSLTVATESRSPNLQESNPAGDRTPPDAIGGKRYLPVSASTFEFTDPVNYRIVNDRLQSFQIAKEKWDSIQHAFDGLLEALQNGDIANLYRDEATNQWVVPPLDPSYLSNQLLRFRTEISTNLELSDLQVDILTAGAYVANLESKRARRFHKDKSGSITGTSSRKIYGGATVVGGLGTLWDTNPRYCKILKMIKNAAN